MTFLDWFSQHFHIVGWSTIVLFIWRASRVFGAWEVKANEMHKVLTNHIPHAIVASEEQATKLAAATQSVKDAIAMHDQREVAAALAVTQGVDKIAQAIANEGRETRTLLAALVVPKRRGLN